MTLVDQLDHDHADLVQRRRRRHAFSRRVDGFLLFGVLASLTLNGIDPRIFGIETGQPEGQALAVTLRLVVYLPLAIGLLAGVPIARIVRRTPVLLLVAFGVWTVVAAVFTQDPIGELDRALWFFMFVLLAIMTTVRIGWERLLVSVGVVTTILVICGLVGHYLGLLPSTVTEFFDGGLFGVERVRGLTTQENVFGRSAAFLALIGLIVLTSSPMARRVPVGVTFIVVGVVGLLASQSRFSIISFLFAALIIVARRFGRTTYPAAALVVVIGACAGIVLVTGSLGPFARSSEMGEATSLLGRTEVWSEAIDITLKNPVVGIGTEGVTSRYLFLDDAGSFGWNPTNAHNVVLQMSASHGLIGAWLLVGAVIIGLARAIPSRVPGTLEIVLMFVIQGFVESILIGNPTIAPLLLIAALTADTVERVGDP